MLSKQLNVLYVHFSLGTCFSPSAIAQKEHINIKMGTLMQHTLALMATKKKGTQKQVISWTWFNIEAMDVYTTGSAEGGS